MADIKWSAFPSIGTLATGDTLVGLRAGANVRFSTVTIPWTVANGGTGLSTTTAYSLIAAGTTATGNFQAVGTGTAGQLLQSGGASALPTWTTSTFPSGAATVNKMLRGDGTNWVATTATTLTSADVLSGLTQLNVDNLRLDGNTISSTDTNGNIIIDPDGTGSILAFTPTAFNSIYAASLQSLLPIAVARYNAASGTNSGYFMGFTSRAAAPGSFSASLNGDPIARLVAYGDDGSAFQEAGLFQFNVVSTAPGVVAGRALLYTSNTSGVRSLGMEITDAQVANFSQSLNAALAITATAGAVVSGATGGGFVGQFQAFSTTAALGSLSLTAANSAGNFANVLTNASTAAARTWTLPDASGTIALTSGASGIVTSGTQNQLAWYAATGTTISGLASANNGFLVTGASGIPSIANSVGGGLTLTAGNMLVNLGYIASGSPAGGAAGNVALYSPTANKGLFQLLAADSLLAWAGTLTNASLSGARTWTFPDASGTIALVGGALGAVSATSLTFTSTSGIIGTTTNDGAAAGSVGEFVTSAVAIGSAVSLTTDTAANVTSISLTAGDWDVWGQVAFTGNSATTLAQIYGWTSATSATFPAAQLRTQSFIAAAGTVVFTISNPSIPTPTARYSLSGTTTIYLSAGATFGTNTCSAFGAIYARRRR